MPTLNLKIQGAYSCPRAVDSGAWTLDLFFRGLTKRPVRPPKINIFQDHEFACNNSMGLVKAYVRGHPGDFDDPYNFVIRRLRRM